ILAVGDLSFQARCFERVEKLRTDGKTVILVSHDLAAIERICDRALLLRAGEAGMVGEPHAGFGHYGGGSFSGAARRGQGRGTSSRVTCQALTFDSTTGGQVRTGAPLRCCVEYDAREALDDVVVTISFNWPSGYLCTQLSSTEGVRLERGLGEIEFFCAVLTM